MESDLPWMLGKKKQRVRKFWKSVGIFIFIHDSNIFNFTFEIWVVVHLLCIYSVRDKRSMDRERGSKARCYFSSQRRNDDEAHRAQRKLRVCFSLLITLLVGKSVLHIWERERLRMTWRKQDKFNGKNWKRNWRRRWSNNISHKIHTFYNKQVLLTNSISLWC